MYQDNGKMNMAFIVACWPNTRGRPYQAIESVHASEAEARKAMYTEQERKPEIPWYADECPAEQAVAGHVKFGGDVTWRPYR